MKLGVVYYLIDPRNFETFYFGETIKEKPAHRLSGHISKAKSAPFDTPNKNKRRIKDILSLGLQPIMVVLTDRMSRSSGIQWQDFFIDTFDSDLCNNAKGSTGSVGSTANRGVPKSIEHKKKIGDAHRGKTISDEQKIKLSKALKGRKKPEGFGERIAEINRLRALNLPLPIDSKEVKQIKKKIRRLRRNYGGDSIEERNILELQILDLKERGVF